MDLGLIPHLLIALGLGLLVGLQREWSQSSLAGIRTFPLITSFGVLASAVSEQSPWAVPAGLVALAAMLVVGNLAKSRRSEADPGLTTEIAALVMYLVGVAVSTGFVAGAVVATGSVAVLLQWKGMLHGFVRRIDEAELRAAAQLVLLALVILPALPDQDYGPYGVLNPFRVWLMVVLIVGISLAAYVCYRLFGARGGTLMAGLLGGLISSTATTVTYAQKARDDKDRTDISTTVIVAASAVVFMRVIFEIAVVAPGIFKTTTPPLAVMMALMLALAWFSYVRAQRGPAPQPDQQPPSTMRMAIAFGLVYVLVHLAVAAAGDRAGHGSLYAVAGLSGLTDMDAITVSTTQLVQSGRLEPATGWRLILVGAMANLIFKAAIAGVIGGRQLFGRVAGYFVAALAGGVALLTLWP